MQPPAGGEGHVEGDPAALVNRLLRQNHLFGRFRDEMVASPVQRAGHQDIDNGVLLVRGVLGRGAQFCLIYIALLV